MDLDAYVTRHGFYVDQPMFCSDNTSLSIGNLKLVFVSSCVKVQRWKRRPYTSDCRRWTTRGTSAIQLRLGMKSVWKWYHNELLRHDICPILMNSCLDIHMATLVLESYKILKKIAFLLRLEKSHSSDLNTRVIALWLKITRRSLSFGSDPRITQGRL